MEKKRKKTKSKGRNEKREKIEDMKAWVCGRSGREVECGEGEGKKWREKNKIHGPCVSSGGEKRVEE